MTSGRSTASPTTVMVLAFSRSTVRQTSSGSSWRGLSGRMMVDPWAIIMKTAHCAAPCIKGGRSSSRRGELALRRSVIPS